MDELTEEVTAANDALWLSGRALPWWREVEAAMRASLVVVRDVLGKGSLEVTPGDHEQVVKAVLADGSHPTLGGRVRVRGAHGELGVAVTNEEAQPSAGIFEMRAEAAGHLGHPGAVGVGGNTQEMHQIEMLKADNRQGEDEGKTGPRFVPTTMIPWRGAQLKSSLRSVTVRTRGIGWLSIADPSFHSSCVPDCTECAVSTKVLLRRREWPSSRRRLQASR